MGVLMGVDIVETARIQKSLTMTASFRSRVFTRDEIEYCESRKASRFSSYAARFAAKEAVSKALGTGISGGLILKDIEVVKDDRGGPTILLHGRAKELYDSMNAASISVSLSHCRDYAVASVAIEVY